MINKAKFYKAIRESLFKKLNPTQVGGMEAVIDYFFLKNKDLRYLAYILATVYHETGGTIQPVREGFGKTDEESIRVVNKLYAQGKIKKNYAEIKPNGKSYFGRGYVQLTWDWNYIKVGKAIGVDIYSNPDLVLNPLVSAKILIEGMLQGWFTGKALKDYFNDKVENPEGARRIINGTDKAKLIAEHYEKFKKALA